MSSCYISIYYKIHLVNGVHFQYLTHMSYVGISYLLSIYGDGNMLHTNATLLIQSSRSK